MYKDESEVFKRMSNSLPSDWLAASIYNRIKKEGGGYFLILLLFIYSFWYERKSIDWIERFFFYQENAHHQLNAKTAALGVVHLSFWKKKSNRKNKNRKEEYKGSDTYADHPNKGGRAQTSPKHQAKMRRPLARLRVILREYCIGRTMAKYLYKMIKYMKTNVIKSIIKI